jgi:hypothetical protein
VLLGVIDCMFCELICHALHVSVTFFIALTLVHIFLLLDNLLACSVGAYMCAPFIAILFLVIDCLFIWLYYFVQEPAELPSILYVRGRRNSEWKFGENMDVIM